MTIQGFQNIHSYTKITAEVFEFRSFGNDLRISVSIGTSEKCISYTVMLLRADTLFFKKNKVIYSCSVLSFYAVFAFQNGLLWCAKAKRQTCIQEN